MKKKISFLAICIGLMMNVLPVQADLIWEPEGDSFYTEHAQECEYINRTYVVNGPNGQVTVYENPSSQEIVDVWEKGKVVHISFAYEDEAGVLWGIYDNGNTEKSGWVPLDHMARKYDSNAFLEEYKDRLTKETVCVKGNEENKIYFWKYPGAKKYQEVSMDEEGMELDQIFVDEEGHKWAYIGYYRGMKQYWVCVDAPAADVYELYPNGAPQRGVLLAGTDIAVVEEAQPVQRPEQEPDPKEESDASDTKEQEETAVETEKITDNTQTESADSQVPLVGAMIAGVMAITAAMLLWLKKSFGNKK